ncbi:MAG: NotI family restriction endonuclease [Bryobacterales bacterium]|nr:NotI family restriction endonuclease [Bryobacterales bacterium]
MGEVLGQPATASFSSQTVVGSDPASSPFHCPFIDARCVKRSTSLRDEPYPICSIRRKVDNQMKYICVCPKRFHAVDFIDDVIRHCWPGKPPTNPRVASEVKLKGFGTVDFVIADIAQGGEISNFLSVELQAVDITGSVMPAYTALREAKKLKRRPTFGLNLANVYKRYVTQLIRKGYTCHRWKTKIVAVMQDVLFDYICEFAEFMRSPDVKARPVNIIFMVYRYDDDPTQVGAQQLVLSKVEGTSHANLQQAVLYKEPPSREDFCNQIVSALDRPSR